MFGKKKAREKSPAEIAMEDLQSRIAKCSDILRGDVRRALALEKMLSILFSGTEHYKTAEVDFAETKAAIIEGIELYDSLISEYNSIATFCGRHVRKVTGHDIVLYEVKAKLF